jgi:PAS domain S-box-containing protein
LIITFAIFRLKLLDLLPVAHQTVFNEMRDGVIVVDDKNRLVDINPAAQRFMLIKGQEAVGQPVMDFLPRTLMGLFESKSDRIASYEMLAKDQKTYVNVYAVPLKSKKNQPSGTLITLQDITNYKQAEMKLKESNIQLQKELQHIEVLQESLQAQALRDPLTNLYNRRYLEEILDREISRAQRLKTPISVMMIDFDNFKQVNDHFSHHAGDQTLVTFAAILNETSRREDIASR